MSNLSQDKLSERREDRKQLLDALTLEISKERLALDVFLKSGKKYFQGDGYSQQRQRLFDKLGKKIVSFWLRNIFRYVVYGVDDEMYTRGDLLAVPAKSYPYDVSKKISRSEMRTVPGCLVIECVCRPGIFSGPYMVHRTLHTEVRKESHTFDRYFSVDMDGRNLGVHNPQIWASCGRETGYRGEFINVPWDKVHWYYLYDDGPRKVPFDQHKAYHDLHHPEEWERI